MSVHDGLLAENGVLQNRVCIQKTISLHRHRNMSLLTLFREHVQSMHSLGHCDSTAAHLLTTQNEVHPDSHETPKDGFSLPIQRLPCKRVCFS